jgi:predicted nucleotidyltransferase
LHRLESPDGIPLDIIPFGGVSDPDSNIAWPPEGHVIMNVLGFDDALADTVSVTLSKGPEVHIPIASTSGLALLKLISWTDRAIELRKKDAQDLIYLARTYEQLPIVGVYEDMDLLERYGYDTIAAGSYILGRSTRSISKNDTRRYID